MSRATGLRLGTSGAALECPVAEAIPVELSPHAAGARDEDAEARARRRRLRWQIGFGAALALAAGSVATVLGSSSYEARGSVLIRAPEAGRGAPYATGGGLQSEVEILQSFEVLRQALESIGVGVLYPGLEGATTGAVRAAAVARMQDALAVRTRPDSDVIEVGFRHRDAQLAADVVNRVVERFRRSRPETLAPAASKRFLSHRIAEQQHEWAAAEASLAAFHTEHPALAGPEPRRELADRRLALEEELRALRAAADGAAGLDDASVARARARLDELELALQETLNSHVEGSRAVSKARNEVGLVREHLASKERAAAEQRERGLGRLDERQRELDVQLAALTSAERELPALERRERELARERDVAARRLDAYQRELEATTLAAAVGAHQLAAAVRVLEAAQAPATRTIPDESARRAWALLAAALAVLLGVFLVDVSDPPRPVPPPRVWTARVGVGEGALPGWMPQHGAPVAALVATGERTGRPPG